MQRWLRVAVGLSGGVDSAVATWILKKRGFDVIGVYMNSWDHIEEGNSSCPQTKDEADARYVCEKLHIPFTTVNFVKEYWNERLHNHAIDKLGADLVATGHYASVKLLCSADPLKDQTPFLCTLQQKQLRRALFPIGSLTKTQVRHIAREQGLGSIADKPESMGICFVGKRRNFDSFIDQYIEPRPGKIITLEEKFIGHHNGVHHFTLGKRIGVHGCHLGYFVAHIDVEKDTIYAVRPSILQAFFFTFMVPRIRKRSIVHL
uniref:tRNA-5-taurinomethyluridine 2-sulfurtransferase n=1 Tax=Angiostrongylus cantonensis TaxID=6313 RepID=A0A0K0CVK6_ANGCA